MESLALGLSVAFSVLALGVSGASWARGVPAKLLQRVSDAETSASETARAFQSFEANARSVLGAVEEERERSVRAQRRASADRVKTDALQPTGPMTRDDQLRELRVTAGLV